MTTLGNPAFVSIYELTAFEQELLSMRMEQYPPTLREGMNPALVNNIVPYEHQTSKVEGKYWGEVCRVSAKQQTMKELLERPVPPPSLIKAFNNFKSF